MRGGLKWNNLLPLCRYSKIQKQKLSLVKWLSNVEEVEDYMAVAQLDVTEVALLDTYRLLCAFGSESCISLER